MRKGIQCDLILISLWGIAQCAPLSTPRAAFRNETRAFCQNKRGSALWGNKGGEGLTMAKRSAKRKAPKEAEKGITFVTTYLAYL